MAYIVTVFEIGGGVALLLGIAVRQVAIALVPVLLGALYVHMGNGWVFSAQNGGWEYPAFLAAATIVQALVGAGRYTVKIPGHSPQVATSH